MSLEVDTALFSIGAGLVGFLFGTVLAETPITLVDVSSALVAFAAVYGILKWKAQHDYQQYNHDKKSIIKLVKKTLAYATESRLAQHELSKNLTSFVVEKNDEDSRFMNRSLVQKSLNRLGEAKERLSEVSVNLEAEVATNSMIEKSTDLQFHIHCLISRVEDIILSSNSTTSVYQAFEVIDQNDDAHFEELATGADTDFLRYLLELGKVEKKLNIESSSLAKIRSFKHLRKIDSEP